MIPCEDFSGDGRLQIVSVHFSSPTNKRHTGNEACIYDQIMHESSYIVARDSSGIMAIHYPRPNILYGHIPLNIKHLHCWAFMREGRNSETTNASGKNFECKQPHTDRVLRHGRHTFLHVHLITAQTKLLVHKIENCVRILGTPRSYKHDCTWTTRCFLCRCKTRHT